MNAMRKGAFQVAKNPFECVEVSFSWIVHEETHLLNGKGNVGSSESQVLESTSKAPIQSRIRDRRTGID